MAELIDQYQRKIQYLRLSVTDRCDLRCFYCMPRQFKGFQEPEEWLSFAEIERVVGCFARLGVSSVRLTGGEPLLRKDLPALVQRLYDLPGIDDISLSTNGTRLSTFAEPLQAAGLARINVSLDSLDAETFRRITQGKLNKTLAGLQAAREVGFQPIKLNMVLMKGINDQHIRSMLDYCIDNQFTLRFIETMPVGSTGHNALQYYVNLQTIEQQLQQHYHLIPTVMPGAGPARYYQIANSATNIGFITPMSQHFCATCNRLRLSVDGTLYLCLGDEYHYPLRPLLRSGISDDGLANAIQEAIQLKPKQHEFNQQPEKVVRFMSMTGG